MHVEAVLGGVAALQDVLAVQVPAAAARTRPRLVHDVAQQVEAALVVDLREAHPDEERVRRVGVAAAVDVLEERGHRPRHDPEAVARVVDVPVRDAVQGVSLPRSRLPVRDDAIVVAVAAGQHHGLRARALENMLLVAPRPEDAVEGERPPRVHARAARDLILRLVEDHLVLRLLQGPHPNHDLDARSGLRGGGSSGGGGHRGVTDCSRISSRRRPPPLDSCVAGGGAVVRYLLLRRERIKK